MRLCILNPVSTAINLKYLIWCDLYPDKKAQQLDLLLRKKLHGCFCLYGQLHRFPCKAWGVYLQIKNCR